VICGVASFCFALSFVSPRAHAPQRPHRPGCRIPVVVSRCVAVWLLAPLIGYTAHAGVSLCAGTISGTGVEPRIKAISMKAQKI
jgi:hypothetical protein